MPPCTLSANVPRRLSLLLLLGLVSMICTAALRAQDITVLAPAAEEVLFPNGVYPIRWIVSGSNFTPTLAVEFSDNDGANWQTLATVPTRLGADTLRWNTPNEGTSRGYIRVREVGGVRSGQSGKFRIDAPVQPYLRLNRPENDDILVGDSVEMIEWLADNVSGRFMLEYSVDSGGTWSTIDTVPALSGRGELAWKVPPISTRSGLVRISTLDRSLSDQSSHVFTIVAPDTVFLLILSPEANSNFSFRAYDSTVRVLIEWLAVGVNDSASIEYSSDGGATWRTVDTVPYKPGPNTAQITLPAVPTTQGVVRVSMLDGSLSRQSNGTFSITAFDTDASIIAHDPMGGSLFPYDSLIGIRWSAKNIGSNLKVQYSLDDGATWTVIDTVPGTGAERGNGRLNWSAPHVSTTRARVRVASLNDGLSDVTDPFTIQPAVKPRVHILFPNGGEMLRIGQEVRFAWEMTDIEENKSFRLWLSRDSGGTWESLKVIGLRDSNVLDWVVAGPLSSKALIRIGYPIEEAYDISDAVFTIAEPLPGSVRMLYPNGGEALEGRTSVTIRWADSNITGAVRVAYSLDNGQFWTVLDTVPATGGENSLTWQVPNVTTSRAVVIVAGTSGSPSDLSDASFTINPSSGVERERVLPSGAASIVPNPSNGEFALVWQQMVRGPVALRLYDERGALVQTLDLGEWEPGQGHAQVRTGALATGHYRYELRTGSERFTGIVTVVER